MKETTKEILKTSVMVIVVVAIIIVIIMVKVEEIEGEYDKFCWEKGFEEATDYRIDYDSGLSHVECDKKHIFFDLNCIEENYCKDGRLNKWGMCVIKLSRMRCIEQ